MQLWLEFCDRQGEVAQIDRLLRNRFGQPGPWRRLDPVSQLVLGMVGGRTIEADSLRAFETLVRRFSSWEGVRDAPDKEIHKSIDSVTYAETKAERLKAALSIVTVLRGGLTLDFLRALRVDDALVWLERLPGVGRKTSAVTLNFSTLRMPALVIDTHHLRVLRRLGLVGSRAGAREAYDRIVPCMPLTWGTEALDDHHQLMKRLGQANCHHKAPSCRDCPLAALCRTQVSGRRPP